MEKKEQTEARFEREKRYNCELSQRIRQLEAIEDIESTKKERIIEL